MNDQTLTCRDCGQAFTFTAGEQEFFSSRGFSEPSRCTECRAARKAQRGGESSYGGSYDGYDRAERQMYTVTCSSCGRDARVPFEPRGDKPVYCSDCFSQRGGGARSTSGARGGRW